MCEFNKIYLGDCLVYLEKLLSDNCIDFIITDPPYAIFEEVSLIRRGNKGKYVHANWDADTLWDRIYGNKDTYYLFIRNFLKLAYRILKPDRHCIVFCDKKDFSIIGRIAEDIGFKFKTPLFWIKTNPVPQARKVSPMKSVETILWLIKGKSKQEFYNWKLGMARDVLYAPIPNKQDSFVRHPTQKPIELGLFLVELLSRSGDLVLDPFCGSGTFCVASKILGRRFIGIESEKKWYEVAMNRLKLAKEDYINDIYRKFLERNILSNCKFGKNNLSQLKLFEGG